jgi:cytochrome P450
MPKILRPVIGKMSAIPLSYRLNKMKRELKPIFQQRMELLKESQNEDEPRDLLQTMLRFAQAERPAELNLDDVAIRLNLMNLGTFHQTSIATTNILFNIVASDKEYNTISILRKEFTTVLAAHDNTWSKAAIAQMTKADSICRETLRINAFGHRSVFKKVMVDNLRTEDGILLPKGAFLSMLHYPIHHDGDLFEDPFKFDPFRFSRIREASEDPKAAANLAFTATGPQFLPFGHGRHSCPGRWFLDFELKMMIAYIVLNYDLELPVEYGGKRPANTWLAEATLPPIEGRLRIRRRKDNSV